MGLKLNGTHQLQAYADDINLLKDNIESMRKEILIDTSVKVDLERNVEKMKYICCLVTTMQVKIGI
jgi:hypothetical protein